MDVEQQLLACRDGRAAVERHVWATGPCACGWTSVCKGCKPGELSKQITILTAAHACMTDWHIGQSMRNIEAKKGQMILQHLQAVKHLEACIYAQNFGYLGAVIS